MAAAKKWSYTVVLTGKLEADDEAEARELAYEEAVSNGDTLGIDVEAVEAPADAGQA